MPENTTTCGTGTTLMGDECVPDGSVICEQGTRFDMATGQCVVDPSACADGTVLVSGECVPEDETLTADMDEAAEPNDAAGAGAFNVPALNADVTIHGCVTPRSGERDSDLWVMTATAPTLIEVTADGVGGLAAGFIVQDNAIPSLPNYFRAGLNLTGDTSKRQVFLPAAGVYFLVMDDSRAILVDEVAGGPDTCYYTTIKTVAMPAATALTLPTTTGTDDGNVRVVTFTADGAGDILNVIQTTTSTALSPAFVVMRNNLISGSPAAPITNPTTGAVTPPNTWQGGMANAEVVTLVIDNQYNFAPTAPYSLASVDFAAQALATDGSAVTVTTRRAAADSVGDPSKFNYLYFDVPANGALMQWNLTSTLAIDMVLLRQNLFQTNPATGNLSLLSFGNIDGLGGTGGTTFNNGFTRFLSAGRYYLVVQDPRTGAGTATVGATYTITSTLATVTPTALTYGTAVTAQALPASGAAFHTIDFTNPTWVEFLATGTNWGTNINVNLYDLTGEGIVGGNYAAAIASTRIAAGTNPAGRIMIGDTRDFLVRVTSSTAPGTGPTYDLNIRTRPHIAVGAIDPATPINRADDAIAATSNGAGAQNATRYLVTGLSFAGFQAVVTPDAAQNSDISIQRLNADESPNGAAINGGGDGAAETLTGVFGPFPNFIAYTVGSSDTEASTIDLALTSTPAPYTPSTGTIAYADACTNGGAVVALTAGGAGLAGDEAQTALVNLPSGWSFSYFGAAQTQFYINSNGFVGFGTPPSCTGAGSYCSFFNTTIPNAADVNGVIAPYWDDLANVVVCRKDDAVANTMTIQWTGISLDTGNSAIQMQARLHMNGVITFIYGAGHASTGGSGTVGIESTNGIRGILSVFNTAAGVAPSTSRTYTPVP